MVERCIALTFDDGPSQYTERLLGYLKKHGAKATFFLVGTQVQKYPEVVRDIRNDGHQLANHSWNHDDLTMLGSTAAAEDIARTNRLISDISGVTPAIMRPPYGATNSAVIDAVGMPEILWSVDPRDWAFDRRDSEIVADDVIDKSDRGDIVLMHDIHKTTVDAVPRILDTLISRGFRLVTVETLLGGDLSVGKYSRQQR